jgi:hypothetical protein
MSLPPNQFSVKFGGIHPHGEHAAWMALTSTIAWQRASL